MVDSSINSTFARECMHLALKKLLHEKPFDKITISELTRIAGVSRSTFYRNYNSVAEVCADFFMAHPFGASSPEEYSRSGFKLRNRLVKSISFLKEEQNLVRALIDSNRALLIYENFDSLMKGLFMPRVFDMGFRSEYEQAAAAGLYFGVCYDWFIGGMKESVDEMADICYDILTKYYKDDGVMFEE